MFRALAMDVLAVWIAPAATMLAAVITAANLGTRATGFGFIIFTLGSICWSLVGYHSGQSNLLATNGVLTLVNCIGVWRWLGRQRRLEDAGTAATEASRAAPFPTLFAGSSLVGLPVVDGHDEPLGKVVEALIECDSGQISYVVVATGGVGGVNETLRAVSRPCLGFDGKICRLAQSRNWLERQPPLSRDHWPLQPPPMG